MPAILFGKQKTLKRNFKILLIILYTYMMPSIAAPLDKTTFKGGIPFLFNETKTPSSDSLENSLFFDTEEYSENIEKQGQIKTLLKSGITQYRAGKKIEGINDYFEVMVSGAYSWGG